ncbi:hypothetical protein HPB47_000050, partial [Ixodes persulcatus]
MSRGPSNLLSAAAAQHQRCSSSRPNFAKADGWPDRCLSSFTNFLLRCLLVIIRSSFHGSGVDRALLRLVRLQGLCLRVSAGRFVRFLLSDGYLAVQDDSARREQDVREAGDGAAAPAAPGALLAAGGVCVGQQPVLHPHLPGLDVAGALPTPPAHPPALLGPGATALQAPAPHGLLLELERRVLRGRGGRGRERVLRGAHPGAGEPPVDGGRTAAHGLVPRQAVGHGAPHVDHGPPVQVHQLRGRLHHPRRLLHHPGQGRAQHAAEAAQGPHAQCVPAEGPQVDRALPGGRLPPQEDCHQPEVRPDQQLPDPGARDPAANRRHEDGHGDSVAGEPGQDLERAPGGGPQVGGGRDGGLPGGQAPGPADHLGGLPQDVRGAPALPPLPRGRGALRGDGGPHPVALRPLGREGAPARRVLPHGTLPGAAPPPRRGHRGRPPAAGAPPRRLQRGLDRPGARVLHHVHPVPRGTLPLARFPALV